MILRIKGNVSESMLIGAMQKAHAHAKGNATERVSMGVGVLQQYLRENDVRQAAWKKLSSLSPEVAMARARLNSGWLDRAKTLLKKATGAEERRVLLGQVLHPLYSPPSGAQTFGASMGKTSSEVITLSADELTEMLQPALPSQELVMLMNPDDGNKSIARDQVTNEQFGVFLEQTGHIHPYYTAQDVWERGLHASVVGVNYNHDAVGFAQWQGKAIPTQVELESAGRSLGGELTALVAWDWVSNKEGNWQVNYSLFGGHRGMRHSQNLPDGRKNDILSFRVIDRGS